MVNPKIRVIYSVILQDRDETWHRTLPGGTWAEFSSVLWAQEILEDLCPGSTVNWDIMRVGEEK